MVDSFGPLVLMHISKTGGSSLYSMLTDAVDPDRVRSVRAKDAIVQGISAGWYTRGVLAGHFDYSAIKKADARCRIVTSLRNPVDRAVSLYRFTHTITDEEAEAISCWMTNFARASDEETFFRTAAPGIFANFSNAQTRQILGDDWSVFALTGDRAWAMSLAKIRLQSMAGFVLVDRFDDCCRSLFLRLGLPINYIHRENVLEQRMIDGHAIRKSFRPLSSELRGFLEEINTLDRELYDFAVWLSNERAGRSEEPAGALRVRASGYEKLTHSWRYSSL